MKISALLATLALLASAQAGPPDSPASPEEVATLRRELDLARGRYDRAPADLRWATLVAGNRAYARARIRSFDTWTAVIFHDRGIATVPIAGLPEAARLRLGYDATKPPPAPAPTLAVVRPVTPAAPRPSVVVWQSDPVARTLIAFGERPLIRREVNLRPDFEQLGLGVKNQGHSPSCAVYAVTAALEYHLAKIGRAPARLSEPYLHWASLRSIGRTKDRVASGSELNHEGGLGLTEVVQALRSYGIPEAGAIPTGFDPLRDTPAEAIQRGAWSHCRVGYIQLNGRTKRDRLEQMILALNEGLPVVIGMVWPENVRDFARTGDIRDRPPLAGYGHAVLITGYFCADGIIENAVFRFRNSYGSEWGDGGYGTVPWRYLEQNSYDGIFLDVH